MAESLTPGEVLQLVRAGESAVKGAQSARRKHARKTKRGDERRERDLKEAAENIQKAMKDLRPIIARMPWQTYSEARERTNDQVRRVSKAMQIERRKIWKMRSHDFS